MNCTLETGLQAPLALQQDPCSVGSMERWQKLSHRLEAQTGGAGRVGQVFCSALLPQEANDTAAITAAKATNFFISFFGVKV